MAQQIVLELPQVEFRRDPTSKCDRNASETEERPIRAIPVIINFRRLFSSPKVDSKETFPGIKYRHLLHAVAALYDQSLPEVTEDIIYSTICHKLSRTILLVQNTEDALEDFKIRALATTTKSEEIEKITPGEETHLGYGDIPKPSPEENSSLVNGSVVPETNAEDCTSEKKDPTVPHEEESRFSEIFSDMEPSDDEEEDDSENYMQGVDEFITDVKRRREEKKRWLELLRMNNSSQEPVSLLGIEHRLLGCATFETTYDKAGRRVIHLALISTRKRYRKIGIGRFMLKMIRDPSIAGRYNAVVVNADHNATDFFDKEGFSSDVLLNSRYADVGDTWYNCKRMCYLPPYQSAFESLSMTDQTIPNVYFSELEDLDLENMEVDLAFYQEKSLQAFQAQALIIERLRKEVVLLRARLATQHDTIQVLTKENASVRDAKYNCEREMLTLKLKTITSAAGNIINFALDLSDEEEKQDVLNDT